MALVDETDVRKKNQEYFKLEKYEEHVDARTLVEELYMNDTVEEWERKELKTAENFNDILEVFDWDQKWKIEIFFHEKKIRQKCERPNR